MRSLIMRGFTLVELVVTLLVVGILAAFAVPRLNFGDTFDAKGFHDQVLSTLQFARKSAIAQRRYVCASLAGGTLSLTIDANPPESTAASFGGACPFATALNLPTPSRDCPAASNNSVCRPTRVASFTGTATLQFDALGRASTAGSYVISGANPITVEQETGYVF